MVHDFENIFGREKRTFWMGLSILWIFMYHLTLFNPFPIAFNFSYIEPFMYLFRTGFIGVDIFLFLSAYGLCCSYNKNNLKIFYRNRIQRIYPLYFIFLMLFYILMIVLGNDSFKDLRIYLLQCTGLSVLNVIKFDIEWFTPSIILLYIIFPALYRIVGFICNRHENILYQVGLLVLCISVTPLLSFVVADNLSSRLPIFILGIFTFYNLNKNQTKELFILYGAGIALSFIVENNNLRYSMSVPSFLLFLSCCTFHEKNRFYKNVSWIGKYSFEIYLAQVLTTKFILRSVFVDNVFVLYSAVVLFTVLISLLFIKIAQITRLSYIGIKL